LAGKGISSSSVRRWVSNLLFVVAAVLFAYVAYAYYQERQDDGGTVPTPQSVPGQAQLKNVHDVIADQDLTVDYGRTTVRIDSTPPVDSGFPVGQELTVEGVPVYVFIFESPEDRAEQTAGLSADSIELKTPSGAEAATGELALSEGSNILAVSDGADQELQEKIDAGVQSLP
jgi:hypothetical protein